MMFLMILIIGLIFGGILIGVSDSEFSIKYGWLGYVLLGLGVLIGICAFI